MSELVLKLDDKEQESEAEHRELPPKILPMHRPGQPGGFEPQTSTRGLSAGDHQGRFPAQTVKSLPATWKMLVDPWVGKIPWRRGWQPAQVFLTREFHGQKSLASYSLRDRRETRMLY